MFNTALLRTAREAMGLTQTELAQRSGLPQSDLSRWERGLRTPTPEQVDRLAAAVEIPATLLASDVRVAVPVHRAAKAETKRVERLVNGRLELARLAGSQILQDVDISAPFEFPTPDDPTPPDPEDAADAIRRVWRVPPGPIQDLTAHIESAGAVVMRVDFGADSILAAYSHVRSDQRWLFINTRATDGARVRFSLAHELGHALLHWDRFDAPAGKDAEREAHRFAAALLLPRREMQSLFARSRLTLDELIHVRQQWKVSIQALVMRAFDLEMISEYQRTRLWKQISTRGWRRVEPGPIDLEEPTIMRDAVTLHRTQHGYSDEEIAKVAGLPLDRLADLMPDYFLRAGHPTLRLVD